VLSGHLDQENSIVARLLSKDLGPHSAIAKIAFFDTKPYMKAAFEKANNGRFRIDYLEARLSSETISLAAGYPIVCIFVNDNVDENIARGLKAMGVELIALRCAGYNNVAVAACKEQGLSVARVPAYSPNAVAEHAVALMLSLNRKTFRAHSRVREGNFALNGLVGFDMCHKTAGIVGTGKIGKCAAKILAGFGCRVVAFDTFKDEEFAERIGMEYLELDDLFAQSDIISLHLPLLPETHYLINAESMKPMKDGVMIVNTGRGALIDTAALLDGLKRGKIGYAGLDVYEEEDDYFFEDLSDEVIEDDVLARLISFNNVIVTSHQAFLTEDALAAIASTTFNNIDEFLAGKRGSDLTNSIDV
jgi:D-lactate dehydrogenase